MRLKGTYIAVCMACSCTDKWLALDARLTSPSAQLRCLRSAVEVSEGDLTSRIEGIALEHTQRKLRALGRAAVETELT